MSSATTGDVVGTARDRVDGRLKVTGAATYPIDVTLPGMAYAVLVPSTVTSGRIRHIAVDAAEQAPGVLAVITHFNAPALARGPITTSGPSPVPPLQGDVVLHYGQHVAMVVAETREQAQAAAALIEVTYHPDKPVLAYDDPRASRVSHAWTPDRVRGDVTRALAAAEVQVNQTYTTAANTNNPIGLFATVAVWNGDALTVHDTTQWPHSVRDSLAAVFGVDPAGVRVLAPFVGGAFGAGLRVWPHVILAVLAARVTKRPVKLVLTRAQMFTSVGHRPNSIQLMSLGASRDGQLTAIEHVATSSIGMADEMINLITHGTPNAYACPNVSTRATQVRQSIPTPGWMRSPGECEGSFALESAIDELSYAVGIDPIELRVKNHAHVHPETRLPWSSNALLDCYRQGAERFGWAARNPNPRSMRNGRQLVGYGMARAALLAYQPPCSAMASIRRDGTAYVRSGATDIGCGTYTVMTMLAADCLGVPIERVRFGLGDSAMPKAPHQGGSGLTGALGNAVQAACVNLVRAIVNRVNDDEVSPLKGCQLEGITVRDGGIQITDDPARFETYADILTRHGMDEITFEAESAPPGETSSAAMVARAGRFVPSTTPSTGDRAHAGAFATHFVEVHVDPDLGTIRVARVVSAVDGGRILNPKTARSQIIGSIAMGIGMALLEETVSDRIGRLATMSLADYLVAVSADVRDVDVLFVGQPDLMTPLGTKGIGELAIIGIAAAIANAVYHATGTRVRSLPICIEKVLGHESPSPRTSSPSRTLHDEIYGQTQEGSPKQHQPTSARILMASTTKRQTASDQAIAHSARRQFLKVSAAITAGAALPAMDALAQAETPRHDTSPATRRINPEGEHSMSTITTKDGTQIYYKDWGSGQPIVFHHGWPLSADDWDAQMMFFLSQGYRVIAHDRRGHGRSSQTATGNDMDTYAADVAQLAAYLDLRNAVHVGHSTGGGEVARYVAKHGAGRVAKAVLIGAVPPIMVKTEKNPGGLPIEVFDGFRAALAANRAQFFRDVPSGPFYGFNRPGAKVSPGVIDNWWRQGMMGGAKAHYDCIKAFSETDFTEDLKAITVPVLILHGDDDQIVPIADSALLSAKLVRKGTLKVYPGLPHGMCTTDPDAINRDLLAFIRGEPLPR